jgi:cytochrome c oxidase assembly protein subunit 15
MTAEATAYRPRTIAIWLFAVAALVFLMVVVGGITRLTESGLSMVRWEPISGIVPPLDAADWQAEFDAYKAYPEYQKLNRGMTLSEFKSIFFWEYTHRLIGRLIGLFFAIPLIFFWMRRAIPPRYKGRLVALLALGGLQGAIGWWMVASGLVDRPDVSHIRLAVHLLMALFIYSFAIWTALDLLGFDRGNGRARFTLPAILALVALFGQIKLGAFVAGLNAGYAFAEWPLMGGHFLPPLAGWLEPAWRNAVDNPIVVQWIHRWWAFVAAAALLWLAVRTYRVGARRPAIVVGALLVLQIALGIATLLSGVQIDIAATHQAVAALLLASAVWSAHALGERSRSWRTLPAST